MNALPRPSGPRSIQRSPSPAPFSLRHDTAPLNLPRRQTPSLSLIVPGSTPPSSTPPPDINIALAPAPVPAPAPGLYPPNTRERSRPKLNIGAVTATNVQTGSRGSNDDESPTYNYYGGGPPKLSLNLDFEGGDQPTIRPPITLQPVPPVEPLIDMSSLHDSIAGMSSEEIRVPTYGQDDLSDDMFEVIERLGEGAGGAVSKVKDKRNDMILARKTITTGQTPAKQVLRELSFMKTTVHRNICRFYGAYISPSSSEVKVLMEICEGRSLEAVGKRIKELGGRVGEKVAGRIAEGVSRCFLRYP